MGCVERIAEQVQEHLHQLVAVDVGNRTIVGQLAGNGSLPKLRIEAQDRQRFLQDGTTGSGDKDKRGGLPADRLEAAACRGRVKSRGSLRPAHPVAPAPSESPR
jgi:hypothetical protein